MIRVNDVILIARRAAVVESLGPRGRMTYRYLVREHREGYASHAGQTALARKLTEQDICLQPAHGCGKYHPTASELREIRRYIPAG